MNGKTKLILMVFGVLFFVIVTVVFAGSKVIEPGYVGIKVNQTGSQKGVQDYPILTGRIFYNPVTERVYEYPTFLQTVVWTKDLKEGAPIDQSLTFNSIEGAVVNVDVSLSYAFVQEKVPAVFVEFRRSPEEITDTYMRTKVRDAFSRIASTMKITDIFGPKKQELLQLVIEGLRQDLEPKGFRIDSVSMVGNPRLDPQVAASINAVIEATQRAQEAENKVKQTEAEARQRVAAAEGEAQAILKVAEAQAKANEILTKSLTPELVRYQAMQKWNGVLPQVTGSGGMPFIQLQSAPPGK